jgi:enoyl-CoA hydratase/carnithine racemase
MSVLYEKRRNGVACVTLNRPEVMNALDTGAKDSLARIWEEISADQDVRVVIVAGAGPKAFCAGSDIKEMNRLGRTVTTDLLLRALPGGDSPLDKPVIAALHGYCIGVGLTLALHCDLRLAATGTILGFPEVRHGMISGISAMKLPQMLPACRALELLLLGETITAEESERIGLINRVVEGNVIEEAERWAEIIGNNSPVAVQATKHLGLAGLRRSLEAERSEIDRMRLRVEASEDFKEGAQAFAEHRSPSFKGI